MFKGHIIGWRADAPLKNPFLLVIDIISFLSKTINKPYYKESSMNKKLLLAGICPALCTIALMANMMASPAMATATADGDSKKPAVATPRGRAGVYLKPQVEVIFTDKTYTKGISAVGAGVGVGATVGYQIKNWGFELAALYQSYGGRATTQQTLFGGPATVSTATDSSEGFIPITLGVNYTFNLVSSGKLSFTPGVAGGVWIHTINRNIKITTDSALARASIAASGIDSDRATEVRGIIVPSLSLNYAAADNLVFDITGKFYLVPNGYSDNYNIANRDAAKSGAAFLSPSYNDVNKFFWYGGLNVGMQYIF